MTLENSGAGESPLTCSSRSPVAEEAMLTECAAAPQVSSRELSSNEPDPGTDGEMLSVEAHKRR